MLGMHAERIFEKEAKTASATILHGDQHAVSVQGAKQFCSRHSGHGISRSQHAVAEKTQMDSQWLLPVINCTQLLVAYIHSNQTYDVLKKKGGNRIKTSKRTLVASSHARSVFRVCMHVCPSVYNLRGVLWLCLCVFTCNGPYHTATTLPVPLGELLCGRML